MTPIGGLITESVRMAASQPVSTAVTAVIVAAVCGVIVSTTGQTVAIERDVLSHIDDAGTRTIVVEDNEGRAGLNASTVERIERLAGVEWAIGFGIARDVRPAGLDGANPVPTRGYVGQLPELVATSLWERQGRTALAGVDALPSLGFSTFAGPVEHVAPDRPSLGVVGWLIAEPPLDFLNRALLTVAEPDESIVRVIILSRSADQVPRLAEAIRLVLDPDDASSMAIRTSDSLVQVRAAVQGELGTWGRDLVTLVLASGLLLTALNVFGAVTTRRRDFGRRRALGASRLAVILLVTCQTIATAIVGAAVGTVTGVLIVQLVLGSAPSAEFSLAIATLAVLATAVAALPPAVIAAYRDPVRILRVP